MTVTVEMCERVATKSSEILSKSIFEVGNPTIQAMRAVLIRQIALADRIGAMIRDIGDTDDIENAWIVMENLILQSTRLSVKIVCHFRS